MLYDDLVPSGQWLAHHGIKGQKWGEKNGPPYPLSGSQMSATEKKSNKPVTKVTRANEWSDEINKYGKSTMITSTLKDSNRMPSGEIRIHSYPQDKEAVDVCKKHYKKIIDSVTEQIYKDIAGKAWLFDEMGYEDSQYRGLSDEKRQAVVKRNLNRSDVGFSVFITDTPDKYSGEIFFDDVLRNIDKNGKIHYDYSHSLYGEHGVHAYITFDKDGNIEVRDAGA